MNIQRSDTASLYLAASAGIIVGASFFFIISALPSNLDVWRGYDNHYCESQPLGIILVRANFPIMTPTLLPQGYSLEFSELSESDLHFVFNSEYHDRTVCRLAAYRAAGSISIVGSSLDYPLGRYHASTTEQLMKSYESAAEHEPNGQKRTFADGRVAIGYGEEKTIVWVFDEKNWTMYQLNAYLSLDDLMQIAESLNSANEIHEVSYKTFDRNLPEIK